jgi:hypothetical protein
VAAACGPDVRIATADNRVITQCCKEQSINMCDKRIGFIYLAFLAMISGFANSQSPTVPKQADNAAASASEAEVWMFDQTSALGGHPTTVLGHPRVIESPYGKAVEFNGVDDALFVGTHPLAGVSAYTWEVIFRPDADGNPEQRFFHLQEQDPQTDADTGNRMLFEIRIRDGQWCLDSFASSNGNNRTLLNCNLLHPLNKWYRVTAVYDGKQLKNYVDDELEGSGDLNLVPQLPGHSSVGVRINKVYYFKGAVLMARFMRRALPVEQFLKMPSPVASQPGK